MKLQATCTNMLLVAPLVLSLVLHPRTNRCNSHGTRLSAAAMCTQLTSSPSLDTAEIMAAGFARHVGKGPRMRDMALAPALLASLDVGEECTLQRARAGRACVARRVADRPHAFLLQNLLSPAECEHLMGCANAVGLQPAETSLESAVMWLASDRPTLPCWKP
eukprot:6777835-Prymnesium_polylepis.1